MIRLNLLPDVKIEYLKTKRIQAKVISIATIVSIAMVALVVLLAVWVFGGQALMKKDLTDKIQKNTAELKSVKDIDKYLTLQNQLANITELHNQKSDYSRLMTYLPQLNPSAPNNVTLTTIELSSTEELENLLSLQGEVKDYTALNTFRDTLINASLTYKDSETNEDVKEPLFESVIVTSSALENSSEGGAVVVFKIDTVYNPNAFLFEIKTPTVSVPEKTTTQSAQSSPDVFGQGTTVKENQ